MPGPVTAPIVAASGQTGGMIVMAAAGGKYASSFTAYMNDAISLPTTGQINARFAERNDAAERFGYYQT